MPVKKKIAPFSVNADISKASTIEKDFYTNPIYFESAKEKIFAASWQFIGDKNMLNDKENVQPFTLFKDFLNEPLVLTKDKENQLHCLSNVCTHRGNIIADKKCTANQLRCKYHGRIFDLNGNFRSMPEFKEVKNFPSKSDNLTTVSLFEWEKFLFVSMNKKTKAEGYLKEMISRMNWLSLNDFNFRADLSKEYTINAHWALYCENYLEGFHIPFVHAGLNEIIDYGNYTTEIFSKSNLQIGYAKDDSNCFDLPETSTDYRKNISAYYFFIFPNMMFNFYPWGLSINIVKPLTVQQTRISFLTYVYDEKKLVGGAGSDLHTVEMEDEEIVQNVQRGIRSRFYKKGRYSVTREQGTHHFHRLIAQAMK